MGLWAELGFGALKSLTGGLINSGFNELGKFSNYKYGEKAAEAADFRWRNQYKDFFTPEAMLKQYQNAGLSPSMMFSNGAHGTGGATAPQGAGASGPSGGFMPIDAPSLAQIANINADTKVKEAEAVNLKEQTTAQQIENYVNELCKDTDVEARKENLNVLIALGQKYLAEKSNLDFQTDFGKLKQNAEIQLLVTQNTKMLAEIITENTKQELNEQQTKTLNAQIDKWQMDVSQKYYELDIMSWNQQAQENWWVSQSEYLIDRLEFDTKKFGIEMDFSRKNLWVNTGVEIGKSVLYSTALIFSKGTLNLGVPKVSFGQPNKVGFQ